MILRVRVPEGGNVYHILKMLIYGEVRSTRTPNDDMLVSPWDFLMVASSIVLFIAFYTGRRKFELDTPSAASGHDVTARVSVVRSCVNNVQ